MLFSVFLSTSVPFPRGRQVQCVNHILPSVACDPAQDFLGLRYLAGRCH